MTARTLPRAFYARDTRAVARALLGVFVEAGVWRETARPAP